MAAPSRPAHVFRFEGLEVDLRAGELRRNGQSIKLQEQPLQILAMLLERPGETVTREEIQHKLWPTDTFVEFDHSINAAIQRLRQTLGDSAENPRFVETMARRGYRFIAPVEVTQGEAAPRPYKKVALVASAALVALLAVILALNVAGLRDRVLRAVGAGLRPAPGQVADLPLPPIQSIAVLPLENLSGDPEQEYFSDGMTEALISEVGQIGALRVISRTSVMTYKGAKKPLPQIAQELNVDALIEGAVLRSGDRVRVTVQLIGAVPERHLWARSYERDLRDVLTLQGEISRAVADEVKAKVTPDVQARLARARPVNPEALGLYLKGSDLLERGDTKKSLEYFQQAVQKDPDFARAYVGIALVYNNLGDGEELASVEAYAKTKAYARQALESDDNLDSAHMWLGKALLMGDWDWSGGEREIKRALEINPNSAGAHAMHGGWLYLQDRREEAIAEYRRALEIDPLVARRYAGLDAAYFFARRYDEAIAQYQKALQLDPDANLHQSLAWAYREKGMYKEAIAEFLQVPDIPPKLGHLGNTYARAGNKAEARKAIQRLIEMSKQRVGTYCVALVYAGLRDKDRAFEWLEKAYQVHDKGMCYSKVDPALDPLRSDPRFQDLLRRMNFPP